MSPVGRSRIKPGEVEEFAAAVERRFGHQQDERRMADLTLLLEARLEAAGVQGYAEYRRRLEQPDGLEWSALAPLLTVPETYFFRMAEHFEALALDVLPQVIGRNRDRKTLRLLSAGCASGEEAYTLRIVLNERFPQLRDWQVSITGVDLSEAALVRAREGEYSAWSLRATSDLRRRSNFVPAGKLFRLRPEARHGVEFRRENLLAAAPAGELPYDVIFCRNVLIYFSEEAIREAVARLMARLAPQGYLFLGPAESLRGVSRAFQLCHRQGTFFYRLKPGAQVGQPAARTTTRAAARSQRDPSAVLPAAVELDPSWFESIRRSSERLAGLVDDPAAKPAGTRQRAPRPADEAAAQPAMALPAKTFQQMVAGEQFSEALALLDAGVSNGRNEGHTAEGVRLLRAVMLTNLGRHAEAESECRALLAGNDLNAGAHFLLGLCREQGGHLDEAVEQMSAATYLDPSFPMAHLHRGLLARRRGERAAAVESFGLALKAVDREEADRLQLFGGGFSREGLRQVCVRELARLEQGGPAAQAEPGGPA